MINYTDLPDPIKHRSPLRDMFIILAIFLVVFGGIVFFAATKTSQMNPFVDKYSYLILVGYFALLFFVALAAGSSTHKKTSFGTASSLNKFASANSWRYTTINSESMLPPETPSDARTDFGRRLQGWEKPGQLIEGTVDGRDFKILYIVKRHQYRPAVYLYSTYFGYVVNGVWQAKEHDGNLVNKIEMKQLFDID